MCFTSVEARNGTWRTHKEGHVIQIEEANTGEETQEEQDRNHTDEQMAMLIMAHVITRTNTTSLTRDINWKGKSTQTHTVATSNLGQNKLAQAPSPHDSYATDTGRHSSTPRRPKPVTPRRSAGGSRVMCTSNTGSGRPRWHRTADQLTSRPRRGEPWTMVLYQFERWGAL